MIECRELCNLAVLSPFVLTTDLVLFLGSEVVLDVERLADFLRGLALDHIGDGLAADVEESLDIHVIGSLSTANKTKNVSSCNFFLREDKKESINVIDISTYKDDLEQHLLIDLHELLVPLIDICRSPAGLCIVVVAGDGIVLVVLAPFNNLTQNGLVDVGEGDGADILAQILEHVLQEDGAFRNSSLCVSRSISVSSCSLACGSCRSSNVPTSMMAPSELCN